MNTRRASLAAALAVVALTAGCSSDPKSSAQSDGQALTEQAYQQQAGAVPYPVAQLRDSLERRNVRERLLRTNKPNAIGYVYLLGMNGNYVGYYVIKGKVSSTQSRMTADQLVVDRYEGDVVVSAPGDDGSYGANEPGIFFFTAEGAMVTTSMDYVVSDQPLPVNAPKLNAAP